MSIYIIQDFLLFRTPSRSVAELIRLNETAVQGGGVSFAKSLKQLSSQPYFQEAIYLASPSLHQEMSKWLAGESVDAKRREKLMLSLYK